MSRFKIVVKESGSEEITDEQWGELLFAVGWYLKNNYPHAAAWLVENEEEGK